MQKLLTLKEVTELFGSNDPKGRYVRNLRTKGLIKGAKFGNKLLFKEEDILEFIENQFKKQN